jgi:hypothetical protein
VNQERTTRLEPNNQIFAATVDLQNSLALEFTRNVGGVVRPCETRIGDLDSDQPPAFEHRCEACAHRLDFGQLGHGQTVPRPGVVAAPSSWSAECA